MSKYDDLNQLEDLRQRGVISEEEFQREKSKILDRDTFPAVTHKDDCLLGMKENDYIMLMHLSQLAGFVLAILGFVAPIILWHLNAKTHPEVDRHGKNIVNFMISMVIYIAAAAILSLVIIGIPLLISMCVLWIVFVVIAAVKASRGEYWKYPLAITFIH